MGFNYLSFDFELNFFEILFYFFFFLLFIEFRVKKLNFLEYLFIEELDKSYYSRFINSI